MKRITGYNRYSIDETGTVISHIKYGTNERVLKQYVDRDGYKRLHLSDDNKKLKNVGVHRLVMNTYYPIGEEEGMEVNHKNGMKSDNRLENLEWCTKEENRLHAISTGLAKHVRDVAPEKKLNDKDRLSVIDQYKPYYVSRMKLATKFGVSRSTIDRALGATEAIKFIRSMEE